MQRSDGNADAARLVAMQGIELRDELVAHIALENGTLFKDTTEEASHG